MESFVETAAFVDELNYGQAVFFADLVVVFAERGGDVDDTGTVGHSYVAVANDKVSLCGCVCGGDTVDFSGGFIKERFVSEPLEVLTRFSVGYVIVGFEEVFKERFGENVFCTEGIYFDVRFVWIDSEIYV